MADGAIEIVVRSINHDGQSLLTPIADAIDHAMKAYGEASKARSQLADAAGMTHLRVCEQLVSQIGNQMAALADVHHIGLPDRDILATIKAGLHGMTSFLVEKAHEAETEAISEDVFVVEASGESLEDCCIELDAFVAKMIEIGDRIVNTKIEKVALRTEFEKAIRDVRKRYLNIDIECDNRLKSSVFTNRGAVYLMFRELISNSFKYRQDNRPLKILVQDASIENETHISIADNGIGIPPEFCKNEIFRLGFRHPDAVTLLRKRNPSATGPGGLGLAIVAKIVDFLDGKIEASGEPDVGTRFNITFARGY